MGDFSIEISVENDGKIISLDTDEMNICVYQETGNGKARVLDITCDKPGGKVIGTLITKVELARADDDLTDLVDLDVDPAAGTIEIYSNKLGGP